MEENQGASDSQAVRIPCPYCQKPTTSLKRFGVLNRVVFIGIYAQARSGPVVACPSCMRKELRRNLFLPRHIIGGNLMWLLAILPYNLSMMLVTLIPGHSKLIRQRIEEMKKQEGEQ